MSLYQTADAVVSLSDSGCRRHSIRGRSLSIRKQMQEFLCQTSNAGDTLSDSGCNRLSIIPGPDFLAFKSEDSITKIYMKYRLEIRSTKAGTVSNRNTGKHV